MLFNALGPARGVGDAVYWRTASWRSATSRATAARIASVALSLAKSSCTTSLGTQRPPSSATTGAEARGALGRQVVRAPAAGHARACTIAWGRLDVGDVHAVAGARELFEHFVSASGVGARVPR
jgi:hypothetical protein